VADDEGGGGAESAKDTGNANISSKRKIKILLIFGEIFSMLFACRLCFKNLLKQPAARSIKHEFVSFLRFLHVYVECQECTCHHQKIQNITIIYHTFLKTGKMPRHAKICF